MLSGVSVVAKKKTLKKKVVKKKTGKKKAVKTKKAPKQPATAPGGVRLFEFRDGKSDKFWQISVSGDSHTVTYGRVGTDGQTKTKSFADAAKAAKDADKLIASKVKKGYQEVTQTTSRAVKAKLSKAELAKHKPFVDDILEDPDELANYGVYADWLTDNGDPRGQLINVQLQLERPKLTPAARKKLKATEKKILTKHLDQLLGELAEFHSPNPKKEKWGERHEMEFARGFLDRLIIDDLTEELGAALVASQASRMIRTLGIQGIDYEYVEEGAFKKLAKDEYANVRHLIVGDDRSVFAEGLELLVKNMPRIEKLELMARAVNNGKLFSLKMPNLKHLDMYSGTDYPLEKLARNSSLQNLEYLSIFPHMLEPWHDEPYINLKGVQALCRSPHLKNLRHFEIHCTEVGDKGIKALVKATFFGNLEVLDLSYGVISNEGALLLAEQDLSHFKKIVLDENNILDEGQTALKKAFPKVDLGMQYDEIDPDSPEHLWHGDME